MSGSAYRGRSGQWAFISHRVTGFLVFMFLLLHVVDVSLVNANPKLYDEVHDLYGNIFMRIFEVGLLAALLFHSPNGLRIIIYDFFPGTIRRHKEMFWAVVTTTLALSAVGGWIIVRPFFTGELH